MTVKISPYLGNARVLDEKTFHFCCLGNFSGNPKERDDYAVHAVDRNAWDSLFEILKPALRLPVSLPGISDFDVTISFGNLGDFGTKGLSRQIPLLEALRAFREQVSKSSPDQPLDVAAALAERPILEPLKQAALRYQEQPALDLLNMVDLGEDTGEASMDLRHLKALFSAPRYQGEKREATVRDLKSIEADVIGQVTSAPSYQDLASHWRSLKILLSVTGKNCHLRLIDCTKPELCDAVFMTFIKPDSGVPEPVDLALTTFDFDHGEADLHVLYHLGRMCEALLVPFVMNAAPSLFGARNYAHFKHVTDYATRLGRPEYAKWRKQRDHSGSAWLFVSVNRFLGREEEGEPASRIWCPGSVFFAALVAQALKEGYWPGELLGPQGESDISGVAYMPLTEAQGHDLGYEGFCAFIGSPKQTHLEALGMNCLASVKVPLGESPGARDFVEYTLTYRFFVGCLSRFLGTLAQTEAEDVQPRILEFIGSKNPEDVVREEDEGQIFYRIKPPFSIFQTRPDVVLGVSA